MSFEAFVMLGLFVCGGGYILWSWLADRRLERESKPPIEGPRIKVTPELREKAVAIQREDE